MSTTTPGAKDPAKTPGGAPPAGGMPPGQIEAPNPLEVWFESNRRNIVIGVVLVVVAIVAFQAQKEISKQEDSQVWGEFIKATGLDGPYSEDPIIPLEDVNLQFAMRLNVLPGGAAFADQYIKRADPAELEKIASAGGKDPRVPLLLWAAANAAFERGEFETAKGFAERLKQDFPKHPFCVESPQPVQAYYKALDEEEDAGSADDGPNYEEPRAGSLVGSFLALVEKEKQFRAAHPELYTPEPLPDGAPKVELTFTIDGTPVGEDGKVVIGLFTDKAPAHCEAFLKLVKDGYFDGTLVDFIAEGKPGKYSREFRIGNQMTRDESDKSKWMEEPEDDPTPVEWEEGVSHWPGTLAARNYFVQEEGRTEFFSADDMFYVNTIEAAHTWDEERVAFGRVISGMEVLKEIIDEEYLNDDQDQKFGPRMGFGPPLNNIAVSAKVLE